MSLWGYDASLSVVGACVCIAVCDPASARSARLRAATSLWARIALGSPWFWCSCSLPCAFACGYVSVGKDCACLSVFLVLVFTAVCDLISASCARWCTDTFFFLGKDCACLSVVLVLSATARVVLRIRFFGQGLRLSLRGPGALRHCARCFADTVYGQGLRLPLRGPGVQRHCARWYADTAYGQGLRLSLRDPGAHVFSAGHHRRPGLLHEAWCSVGCTGTGPGLTPAIRAGKGWRGRRESDSQVTCHPN